MKDGKSEFNVIYNENYNWLRVFVYKMTKNIELADDIVSETFTKAYKHISKFDSDKAKITTWLGHIAKNTYIDYYRKEKNKPYIGSVDSEIINEFKLSDILVAKTKSPEQLYDNNNIEKDVLVAISQLKKQQYRDIAKMFFIDELSHQEIVDLLDIPLNTVKVNIFRIREKLQFSLSKYKEAEII